VNKSIYRLIDLRKILLGCNQRYLAHLSSREDFSAGVLALGRLTKPRVVDLRARQNPRVNIAGIRRAHLLPALAMFSPGRLSREDTVATLVELLVAVLAPEPTLALRCHVRALGHHP
jgi:hypothetical protein